MKIRYYSLMIALTIMCLTLASSECKINTESKDYGTVHKKIFNSPDNCIFCHLYDEDLYKEIEGKSTAAIAPKELDEMVEDSDDSVLDDEGYEYDDDDEKSEGGGGWFFGRRKKRSKKLSTYINQTYKSSGFKPKEYISPHEFSKNITSMCVNDSCHTDDELGMSHVVDISPYDTYPNMKVPAEIPLNWDTEKYEEVISCGSCHNPHIDWLSPTKSYLKQDYYKKVKGRKLYKTNYVRIQDPKKGYYTLYSGCHKDY